MVSSVYVCVCCHGLLSIFPGPTPCEVPCETVGAILLTANRAAFLLACPYLSPHRRTERQRAVKREGLVV